jgi:integrase
LYGAGLRVSEALNLTLPDVDTSAGTLRIRDSKNGEGRTIPITVRLTATLDAYTAAAHPAPEHSAYVFYSRAAAGRSTSRPYTRGSAATWPMPAYLTSSAVPTRTRCATASPSPTCGDGPQITRTWP